MKAIRSGTLRMIQTSIMSTRAFSESRPISYSIDYRFKRNNILQMRKTRRAISSTTKYFHIESDVSAELENITIEEAFGYQTLVGAVATICGYDLLFWSIHPRGIHLLVKTQSLKARETHSTEMVEAYKVIGEPRIAASLTSEDKLDTATHERLLRHRKHYGDLLAKTAGVTGGSLNKWPTPLQQLNEVNTPARDGLNQLFKSEKSHA
jgi:hypothetical protein